LGLLALGGKIRIAGFQPAPTLPDRRIAGFQPAPTLPDRRIAGVQPAPHASGHSGGRLEARDPLLRRALSYGGMVAVAGLVVWALYLFEVRMLPGGTLPLPAASHVERWLRLQANLAYGRESFLLGQNGMHGWWAYFPIAFALKTPLPTLILTGVAIAYCGLQIANCKLHRASRITQHAALTLFPLVYALFSLTSGINIGYRHLLPVLPFLFIFASSVVANRRAQITSRNTHHASRFTFYVLRFTFYVSRFTFYVSRFTFYVSRITFYALLTWLALSTLLLSPHYLTYFNELAGGPDQGYRFLADSNTDWGQGLKGLAEQQRRGELGPVRLSLFTFLDPAAYGVQYEPIAPMAGAPPVLPRRLNPAPGLYAISATTLDGVPLPLPSTYDWFRHREPLTRIGHALFVYQVGEGGGSWLAQCTQPVAPLTGPVAAEGFGAALRQIVFDCEQSWVWPGGGDSAGWYARATPGIDWLRWPDGGERLEWWPAWTGRLPRASLSLSYVQPTPGESPAFAAWEWAGAPVEPPATGGEVALGGTLAFLGYDAPAAARPGETVDVLTWWRVLAPPARPLSLMLHLNGADGAPLAVGDGLGVPIDQWRTGDIIVQRHRLTVPPDTLPGAHPLRSGAYWLDDMTSLGNGDATDISLTPIEINP